MTDFETALENFINVASSMRAARGVNQPDLQTERGRKNVKVISESYGQRSVYCFVEIATGHILKAASWKAPAKGVRGSIYSDDKGLSAVTEYGAVYAR
ncbi:hypothetical protein FDI40_gp225 [Agrobacterium phage Atu_ph07]|uniref:Uncharacterized protein n=1 Tax=Agrobacterium phage Atu_ph07 TaxID=2024264 RepID=A0A2L0UZQ1_9CAUD|nr:hypothetical protein FDI40_gp225 [Agrobacterium phage Atu_ph07]AUZ95007.1 hypothetical protein [Agrobacterium phage Atu_ph07]